MCFNNNRKTEITFIQSKGFEDWSKFSLDQIRKMILQQNNFEKNLPDILKPNFKFETSVNKLEYMINDF